MRFLKALALVVSVSCVAAATGPRTAVRSSFTATADSAAIDGAQWLRAVIVSTTSTGSILTLYNSTHTTENQVTEIDLGTIHAYDFEDLDVKGIFYEKTGVSGVTILYRK